MIKMKHMLGKRYSAATRSARFGVFSGKLILEPFVAPHWKVSGSTLPLGIYQEKTGNF